MQESKRMQKARSIIDAARGKASSSDDRCQRAIELAALMLEEAQATRTSKEERMQAQLARMLEDAHGKAFITAMTDQCFRSRDSKRIADQLAYMLNKYGPPHFLTIGKRVGLYAFKWLGKPLSFIFAPLIKHMMRQETSAVILPGEYDQLAKHMQRRRQEGVRINLNHLGEAILGEEEAARRLQTYLEDLSKPEIEYISVKISTICSQLNLLAWDQTLHILSERLKCLYRAARDNHYIQANGQSAPKFVNLDMEEYRDLHLTAALFRNVLSDPEFHQHSAGIVLQSYLPESYAIQQELTAWAKQRVADGGAPIKIRIVRGANLAMEQVEASLHGWPQAPYLNKIEVDANFKRMTTYGCDPENVVAAHIGIGSHNLFDIAYALLLRAENSIEKYVIFEMLEGMADQMRRVVQRLAGSILLYCPAATEGEFQNAVAYLIRRFDENTAPDNFLRHAFALHPGTPEWRRQAALFACAVQNAQQVSGAPRRTQNRWQPPLKPSLDAPFENEPDTDWSLPHNRAWGENIIRTWGIHRRLAPIPLMIGQEQIFTEDKMAIGEDPSRPGQILYRYSLANEAHIDKALQIAQEAFPAWSKTSIEARSRLLAEAAQLLRCRRRDLIGAMTADVGKTIADADVEVSEAIDFAEYYRRNLEEVVSIQDIQWKAKGVVLIAPPWNFPCSIPIGGILAALAVGNCVIFKPACEAVLVGWRLAQLLWEAGVSHEALQFITCEDDPVGSQLVSDKRLASVVLTGATATAKLLLKLRPGLDLIAETGGKNAIIISALSDRDLAVKDLVQSAFGYAGQKCSACSLAVCEAEVYDDPHFRNQLRDAAASLAVGSPWNLTTRLNPLIHAPNAALMRGLTTLEDGEEWLLEPKADSHNPNLWSPGIKLGVKPGSFTYQNELFGPVLALMRADNLEHALQLVNGTPYGLTSGLHSLDEREHRYWIKHIEAGNCYINRGITGAVVQRQPFGGCKQSSFGPGAKAGGPNYVMQLMRPEQAALPSDLETPAPAIEAITHFLEELDFKPDELQLWKASVGSYAFFWKYYFSQRHDPSHILGQDNFFYYVPYKKALLRMQSGDSALDAMRVVAAAATCSTPLEFSVEESLPASVVKQEWFRQTPHIRIIRESQANFIKRFQNDHFKRVRLLSPPNSELQLALADAACNVAIGPALANGRIELLHYLREVSLSVDYHRYGNLGVREGESRAAHDFSQNNCQQCGPSCCRHSET